MGINHVLLEVFCLKNTDENVSKLLPEFCTAVEGPEYPSDLEPGYSCLANRCPFMDFTTCEHTLCYINKKSEMEHGILFDYENYPDEVECWKQASVEAVERTYQEFMKE